MEMSYGGHDLTALEYTFDAPKLDEGPDILDVLTDGALPAREIRIVMPTGTRFPHKRGTEVEIGVTVGGWDHEIEGVVRFRRLNVGVITGRVHRIHRATALAARGLLQSGGLW
jgi:hypothetical protein